MRAARAHVSSCAPLREQVRNIYCTGGPGLLDYRRGQFNKKALQIELDQVIDEGLAVDDEEYAPGLVAIAAPVRDEKREVAAAINLAANTSMIALGDSVRELGPYLVATADHISARLGHRRDDEARR